MLLTILTILQLWSLASAFQPNTSTQYMSTFAYDQKMSKLFSISDSNDKSSRNSNRRGVLTTSLATILSTSGLVSFSRESSAADTSGYIPDMAGGLKKPKGVGGLTKKIRKVGDIMVR
jgi:hypothetical protein